MCIRDRVIYCGDYMRLRCVKLARGLKKTGSFCYHCGWHATPANLSAKTEASCTIR